ncbi:hypothetical protein ILYODFUR_036846 [Ilyodon furcidens]|uniref:Secreted protein n=1 Tax=Ilyodon furcidens TaxID=33524 RepID=A0ABV0UQ70_9TELE
MIISALFLSSQSLSGVPGGRGRTIGKGMLLCNQWHHGKSAATVCLAVPELLCVPCSFYHLPPSVCCSVLTVAIIKSRPVRYVAHGGY